MKKYTIGIDTGGTYTDGVLLDNDTRKVIATAKSPTTHHRLATATGRVLAKLLDSATIDTATISKVVVSSTLATNSVVENKGARVAVIVIGYVKHFKLPVTAVAYVKGGHNIRGEEEEPLDLDYLVELIQGLQKEVDAYGVCAAMAIKNPTHELVAEKAITMIDPKPVFCSHRISQLAGMQERAATAALHAKLMPIMDDFIKGVQAAMAEHHLHCPLAIIGGNGVPLSADRAVTEAGLTVASGPACTASFGASQQYPDCLVIDVGGTTTDVALVAGGRLTLGGDGCTIGRWRTHVEAVDMRTEGIGGDSHVHLDERGQLTIGPVRVAPLSMIPEVPPVAEWLDAGGRSRLISVQQEMRDHFADSELEQLLLTRSSLTPQAIREATGLGGIPLERRLEQLARSQLIYQCGFTPTEALQVLGELDLGDRQQAQMAATILGKKLGLGAEDFSRLVVRKTEEKIETLIIEYIMARYWENPPPGFLSCRHDHPVLAVDIAIKLPLVGIGAAARCLLPRVAERLQTKVYFPDHCEVGNAIGAALIGVEDRPPAGASP